MKIAIAAENANLDQLTGVEHYTRELILALARIDRDNQYLIYLRSSPKAWCADLPSNFTVKCMPSRFMWTQLRLSLATIADRPDALLIPSFSMPLIHPRNTVVTIHDMAWLLFPETETRAQRLAHPATHWFAKLFARKLIAVSESTRRDLIDMFGVSEDRVATVHHGFSHAPSVGTAAHTPDEVVDGLPKPFIVCLGTLQPRKNISRMIDAFVMMKERTGLPHSLVIAGRPGWMCDELLDKMKATADVVYLGYVKDRFSLLRSAALLVQPALYEGFGLSILDAFSQGVPVACSNTSSLPEVAGDAAELFDPYSVESIAAAMAQVLTDLDRAARLREQGCKRLKTFTWDACARKTLGVLQEQPI